MAIGQHGSLGPLDLFEDLGLLVIFFGSSLGEFLDSSYLGIVDSFLIVSPLERPCRFVNP